MRLSNVDIREFARFKDQLIYCFKLVAKGSVKQQVNLSLNPANSLISTFDCLTRPPPPLFPFFPLAVPANTLVSLHL